MKENEELEELLTELDPPYQSKEELQIGRMLDQYGIPFFYRQPTIVHDAGRNEVAKPSFTLYSFGGTVIDYVADSRELPQREQLYRYNQIPAVIVGPRSLTERDWDHKLYEKLQQAYREPVDPMAYMAPAGSQSDCR